MNLEDYKVGESEWGLSNPYSSDIHFCFQKRGGKKYVLKKNKGRLDIDVIKRIFSLSHENLLLPVEWDVSDGRLLELYEWIEWPRLDKFLYSSRGKEAWNLLNALCVIRQLTDVLSLFHSNKIIHHDVRDVNVFINPDNLAIKLFDYSHSREPYFLPEGISTHHAVPPEYREGNCWIDYQLDVYQVGNVFKDLTHKVNSSKNKMVPMFTLPSRILDILGKSMAEDKEKRYKNCLELSEILNF